MAQDLRTKKIVKVGVSLGECGPNKAVAFDCGPDKKAAKQFVELCNSSEHYARFSDVDVVEAEVGWLWPLEPVLSLRD
jgi:hypothetical protein